MPAVRADIVRLSQLLDEALEVPAAEREAWLASLPAKDAGLASQLREMLLAHGNLEDNKLFSTLPKLGNHEASARADERVGPYRLIREIGRGGMGSVWLAERADGNFERQLALKLPRLTCAQGLSDRMARERRIGALLEHPNIARMYDAGVDEHGRPFIAMEYIDGVAIDKYVLQRGLDLRATLTLYLQVIRAVAYAHGRLVIHRDLKPPNVLVDEEGHAHLLDFGIAKLLSATSDGAQLSLERVLTPQYAAPEQIADQPVSVTADVYSLGVMLFELVTGALPYTFKRLTPASIEDAILAGDVPLASSVATAPRQRTALRGEVDAILAKAMKREPEKRYATADALADDIERHLQGERILAHPDSAGYRLRVALRRHKFGVLTSAVILGIVLVGGGVVAIQAQRAAAAAQRQSLVTDFVSEIFRLTGATESSGNRLQIPTGERFLKDGAELIEKRFDKEPELEAQLLGAVGQGFLDMGAYEQATNYLKRRVDKLRSLGATASARAEALMTLSRSLARDGYWDTGDDLDVNDDAEQTALEAVQAAEPLPVLHANALAWRARVLHAKGNRAQTLAILDALSDATARLGRPSIAESWLYQVKAKMLVNDYKETTRLRLQAIEIALQVEGKSSTTAAQQRLSLAVICLANGEAGDAKRLTDQAFETYRRTGGPWALRSVIGEARWAPEYYLFGVMPYLSAAATIDSARRSLESQAVVPKSIAGQLEYSQGLLQLYYGDAQEAWPLMKAGSDALLKERVPGYTRFSAINRLADAAMLSGHYTDAEALLKEQARVRASLGESLSPLAVYDFAELALLMGQSGRFEQAIDVLARIPKFDALSLAGDEAAMVKDATSWVRARLLLDHRDVAAAWESVSGLLPHDVADAEYGFSERLLYAELQCARGEAGATARLEAIADAFSKDHYAHALMATFARAKAGLCAAKNGDYRTAGRLAEKVAIDSAGQPGVADYYKQPIRELQAILRTRRAGS